MEREIYKLILARIDKDDRWRSTSEREADADDEMKRLAAWLVEKFYAEETQ